MAFKLLLLSVMCVFIIQPAHCFGIISTLSNAKTAAVNTVSNVASIVPNVIKAKGSAVVRGAARTGNNIAVGAGLTVETLEKLSSSITGTISNGLVAMGRLLSRRGTGIVEDKLNHSPYASLGQIPEDNNGRILHRLYRHLGARWPYAYRVIYTPRVYRGPYGTIRIQ